MPTRRESAADGVEMLVQLQDGNVVALDDFRQICLHLRHDERAEVPQPVPEFYVSNIVTPDDDPNFRRMKQQHADLYLKTRDETAADGVEMLVQLQDGNVVALDDFRQICLHLRHDTPDDDPNFRRMKQQHADLYLKTRDEEIRKAEAEAAFSPTPNCIASLAMPLMPPAAPPLRMASRPT